MTSIDEYAREVEERRRQYLEAPHRFYVFAEGDRQPMIVNAKSHEDAALCVGSCGRFSVHRSGSGERVVVDVRPAPTRVAIRR